MKKIVRLLSLSIVSLMLSSCGAWYFAKPVDAPLLDGKGDFRATVSMSTIDILPAAFNGAVSYALTDHIGAQAFGAWYNDNDYYAHVAGGYYTHLSKYFVLEFYAGGGIGKSLNPGAEDPAELDTDCPYAVWFDYNQFFGQLDLGWRNLPFLNTDLGLGLRGGMMPYTLHVTDRDGQVLYDHEKGRIPLFEPVAFLRFGFPNLKFQFSVTYCSFVSFHSQLHDKVYATPFSIQGGICLDL